MGILCNLPRRKRTGKKLPDDMQRKKNAGGAID
jgi:hypothetical protein